MRDARERDHDGAPLGERVALVAAQALARVALAAEQSGGFLAGACEPLAAQAASALAQAMGRVQTDEPHAAVWKARLVVKLQHHGGEGELAQGARARAIGGALGHALARATPVRAPPDRAGESRACNRTTTRPTRWPPRCLRRAGRDRR